MIRRLVTVLLALLLGTFFTGPESGLAQETSDPGTSAVAPAAEQLEQLIVTLESDTARQQFISNLETLLAARRGEEQSGFSFSSLLELEETSDGLLASYLQFIRGLGLSDTAGANFIILTVLLLLMTLFVLLNNWLAKVLDRRFDLLRERFSLSGNRFRLVFLSQRVVGYALALLLTFYAMIFVLSGPGQYASFRSIVDVITEYTILFLFVFLLLVTTWEGINTAMEVSINRSSSARTGRVKTLLPVIRNLIFVVIVILCTLVLLSEFGVDIVPLLAGAGVLGIAVGFGAQTMVQDFLTGFTIVLEDLLQVGDVVSVAGRTGIVERITQKLQLRSLDGTVHTVPNSEVAVVDNLTKEFSHYLMDIGVAYGEDTDSVVRCLEKVDQQMREDSDFSNSIIEPLQVLGVDRFDDSAVIIRVRTKTAPHDKWKVGREFNRRIKIAFDKEGIEIPFPHRTLYFGESSTGDHDEFNARTKRYCQRRKKREQ